MRQFAFSGLIAAPRYRYAGASNIADIPSCAKAGVSVGPQIQATPDVVQYGYIDDLSLYTRVKQGVANMAASEAAEDALRKSEQRFKSLFEHPGDSIIIMDSALRIHDANQRACLEFSDTREELLKLPASEVEAQCGPNAAFWYALRAGQTQLGQGLKRRKNGSTVLAEVHISRFEEATRNFPGRRPRHRWAE